VFDVQKEILDTHEARLTVTIADKMQQEGLQKAAKKIAEQVNIPGFRKGKAPYAIVLRQVGEKALQQEAAEIILDEIYPQLIDQEQIEPYGPGQLEAMELTPLVYKIRIPLEPVVDLGDYKSLRREWTEPTVAPEEMQRSLEQIQDRQAVLEPVERPVEMGDQIECEELHGWIEEDGEKKEFVHEHDFTVVLKDKNPFISADFIQALVGLTKGEEKMFRQILPSDMGEELNGKEATFEVKVAEIYARTVPDLDDALASTVGPYETLDQLKEEVSKRLKQYKLEQYKNDYDQALVEALVAQATIVYPPLVLEEETDTMMEQLDQRYKEDYHISLDDFARFQKKTRDQIREELTPRAEERIKQRLVLRQLAKEEAIKIETSDISTEFQLFLQSLGMDDPTAAMQNIPDKDPQFLQELQGRAFGRKVFERLEQIARGEAE